MFRLSCYSAASRLILAPRREPVWTDSSARSPATGRRAWARHRERGQGSPPMLTLICIPPGLRTTLTFCTSSLCSHSREKAIRTNADEEHGLKTSRKKPFPQVLPSASHHPYCRMTPLNSIYSETTAFWEQRKGSRGSSYDTEIGPSVTDITFSRFFRKCILDLSHFQLEKPSHITLVPTKLL